MDDNKYCADFAHYQWLDFFRFICAFLVVICHARGFLFVEYSELNPEYKNILTAAFYGVTRLGHEAVIAFFVLSGYFVGGKALEKLVNGSFSKVDYAVDRISRIFLPLIPTVVFAALVAEFDDGAVVLLGNILGLQGWIIPVLKANGPLWSLAYEIWFYLLVYVLADLHLKKKIGISSLLSLLVVAWVFSCLNFQYLVCWGIGALFYYKVINCSKYHSILLISVGILGLQYISPSQLTAAGDDMHHILRPLLEILLSIGFAMLCTALKQVRSNAIAQISVKLAAFSYTLYLVHYPTLYLLREVGYGRADKLNVVSCTSYGLSIALCFAVAWIFYWVFERNTAVFRVFLKKKLLGGDLQKHEINR